MADQHYATLTVTPLAGWILPAPVTLTLEIRRRDSGSLADVPGAEIRMRAPTGPVVSLLTQHSAVGTYEVGTSDAPLVLDQEGIWTFEGHSYLMSDLVQQATRPVQVLSNGFPASRTYYVAPSALKAFRVNFNAETYVDVAFDTPMPFADYIPSFVATSDTTDPGIPLLGIANATVDGCRITATSAFTGTVYVSLYAAAP